MWKREIDGRALTFRLAGINNQNFLMRDDETGSYWQQISGKAISGPLRGRQLELIHSDELTFDLWRRENPSGAVLRPVAQAVSNYARKDWEVRMKKAQAVVDTKNTPYPPRELMLGVETIGAARAYLFDRILEHRLIQDRIGGTRVILVLGPDNKSVRAFDASQQGDFYRTTENGEAIMMDSQTASDWNFQGCAIRGPAQGRCLHPLPAIKDYWFDWHLYHPTTTVYAK